MMVVVVGGTEVTGEDGGLGGVTHVAPPWR